MKGGQIVSQTVEGINRVATSVNLSARTIEMLGKSSEQIGEIVSVIDEIADQTSAGADQSLSLSRNLDRMAAELKELVDRFNRSRESQERLPRPSCRLPT